MLSKRFNIIPLNVIVIGCGGTGSRVIPWIAQYLATLPSTLVPTLTLIDGDIVEPKNLSRQNFIQEDVGLNKAVVLADRYSDAYGVPIVCIPEFYNQGVRIANGEVRNDRAWSDFLSTEMIKLDVDPVTRERIIKRPQVIISCVDSVTARLNIVGDIVNEKYVQNGNQWQQTAFNCEAISGCVIIDAGNENTYGQVRIYNPVFLGVKDGSTSKMYNSGNVSVATDKLIERLYSISPVTPGDMIEIPFIPAPLGSYINSLLNVSAADRSCADLDQTMAVNVQMATGIFQMFQNLAMNHPFKHHTWYYDLHNGNTQVRMDKDFLRDIAGNSNNIANDYRFAEGSFKLLGSVPAEKAAAEYPRLSAVNTTFLDRASIKELIEMQSFNKSVCHEMTFIDHMAQIVQEAMEDGLFSEIPPEILAIVRGEVIRGE